jgi:hypothetical protein
MTRFYISLSDNYFLSSSCREPSLMRGRICDLQFNHASSSSSYIAAGGQFVLLSGRTGAPSLTRGWVCNLLVQLLLGLARVVTLGSKSRRTHNHILLSDLRLPNLEGKVPIFISPRNGVAQLYPFVSFHDSQGYGGGIRTRLHTGEQNVNHRPAHCCVVFTTVYHSNG